jgi:hypothetical protein
LKRLSRSKQLVRTRTCITTLPDGRFTIADLPEESPASFAPLTPALSEKELYDELVLRGVSEDIAKDLIMRVKNKATELF